MAHESLKEQIGAPTLWLLACLSLLNRLYAVVGMLEAHNNYYRKLLLWQLPCSVYFKFESLWYCRGCNFIHGEIPLVLGTRPSCCWVSMLDVTHNSLIGLWGVRVNSTIVDEAGLVKTSPLSHIGSWFTPMDLVRLMHGLLSLILESKVHQNIIFWTIKPIKCVFTFLKDDFT